MKEEKLSSAQEMKIENTTYSLKLKSGGKSKDRVAAPFAAALGQNTHPLRFSIFVDQLAKVRPAFDRDVACGLSARISVRVNSQSPHPR